MFFFYYGLSVLDQQQIGRAWYAIGKLRPIFISKISDANKMRLFKATVETIAAYELESVPMTPSLCWQIGASHRQMVRAALGITWPETVSTAELTQRAKLIPLSRTTRKCPLRLVGDVIRMQPRCQTPLGWQSRVFLTWSTRSTDLLAFMFNVYLLMCCLPYMLFYDTSCI